MALKDLFLELMEEIQDARGIGNHGMDIDHAVIAVRLAVHEFGGLLDIDDGIDAETAHALVQPEVGCIVECLPDLRIFPVQIRLGRSEGVQVILLTGLAPGPGTAAKDGPPVGGRRAIGLGIPPDIPVAVLAVPAAGRVDEPGMLIGGMVIDQIHDHADAPAPAFRNQAFHIGHRAIGRINAREIGDIIAVIHHR